MEQRSVEETWAENLRCVPELVGRYVKLTLLSEERADLDSEATLDQLIKDRVGRVQ